MQEINEQVGGDETEELKKKENPPRSTFWGRSARASTRRDEQGKAEAETGEAAIRGPGSTQAVPGVGVQKLCDKAVPGEYSGGG